MIWVYYYRSSFSGCCCSGGLGTLKVLLHNTIELATGGPCDLPFPVFTFSLLDPVSDPVFTLSGSRGLGTLKGLHIIMHIEKAIGGL